MKLRALRVREVGCFSDAVAVEGLSGGFDVLAGRNEAGKSTLFRALETLFAESYKTESQKLRDVLTPYSGGAPLIEAEVEVEGQAWRYRKQYFSGRMAELQGAGTLHRNADAEARMSELLGGAAHTALLWVGQGDALVHAPPAEAGRDLLMAAISQEVVASAGGRRGEVVRRAAEAELEALVTLKQQRPRGPHKAARDRLTALEQSLSEADAACVNAEAHMQTLARLRDEAALLGAPATAAARQEQLVHLVRQLADDDRLAADIAAATERRDHLMVQAAQAEEAHRRFNLVMEDHARLGREIAEATVAGERLAADSEALRTRAGQSAARLVQARAEEQRLSEAVVEAGRRAEAERLWARIKEGEAAREKRDALASGLAGNLMTPLILDRVEAEVRAVALLEDRIKAAAPVVEVTIEKHATAPVLVDGKMLDASTSFRPVAPLTFAIPGVAAIRVLPPIDAGEDLAADVEAHLQTLTGLLDLAGVDAIATARKAARERAEAERAIAGLEARLLALVPEGIEAARRTLAAMPQSATSPVPGSSLDALGNQLGRAKSATAASAAEEAAALAALNAASTRKAVEEARLDERRGSLAKLAAELPSNDTRGARLDELKSRAGQLKAKTTEATETVAVLSRRRLATPERQRLAAQRAEIAAEVERIGRRLRDIERETARLDGLIERDGEAATGPERDRLRDEVERARREVARFETEVAGLTLLEKTLGEVAALGTSAYLKPVLERIAPHLAGLLDAPSLALSGNLGLASIDRRGRAEPGDRLSAGTREQIAVLVRLAYGDILAASGRPIPLVLDDALVYSDDERLVKMLAILKKASHHHQVILLSCRTRVMAEAGFRPLELRPWRLS